MERWIAARPWETRLPVQATSPNKAQTKATSKTDKKVNASALSLLTPIKPATNNGKVSAKRVSPKPTETSPKPPANLSHPKTKGNQDQNHRPQQSDAIAV